MLADARAVLVSYKKREDFFFPTSQLGNFYNLGEGLTAQLNFGVAELAELLQ